MRQVASLREEVKELMSCIKALSGEVQRMGVKLEQNAAAAAAAGAGGAGAGLDGSSGKDGSQGGAQDKKAIIRQLAQARQYDAAMKEVSRQGHCEKVGIPGPEHSLPRLKYSSTFFWEAHVATAVVYDCRP